MIGKALLFRVSKDLARNERGNIAIMAAGTLFMALLVLGLVVDFGFAFNLRAKLQHSADAAALAGASQLGNATNVRSKANTYAALNMAVGPHGDVLANADIKIGNWNATTRVFTTNGSPENAVHVTTRRTFATGNQAPAFFGPLLNIFGYDIVTEAVATNSGGVEDCVKNGFIADGKVFTGSQNVFKDGFCIHGEKGVKVGSENEFHDGVEISMQHYDNEANEGDPGYPAGECLLRDRHDRDDLSVVLRHAHKVARPQPGHDDGLLAELVAREGDHRGARSQP